MAVRPNKGETGSPRRVSVIVPCFNYGHWLDACVLSALAQPEVAVDVLIVNDASVDDTSVVAHRLAAEDGRVRVIDHAVNRGHIASVNEALESVSGQYIVKLDADDLLTEGSLARSVALLEANPQVGFVYGRALRFGRHVSEDMSLVHRCVQWPTFQATDHPRIAAAGRLRGWRIWRGEDWLTLMCRRGANCISQPEVVIRAATLRRAGSYNPRLPHTSDLEMWLRLAAIADVGHIDGAIQGLYRVHPGSMQRTVNAGRVRDCEARLTAFESALSCSDSRDREVLLRTVRTRLAAEALQEACQYPSIADGQTTSR